MEADFQATYSLDLGEMVWGPSRRGCRRLLVLIDGLSPRGALARSLDQTGGAWSIEAHLLARLASEVREVARATAIAGHVRPVPQSIDLSPTAAVAEPPPPTAPSSTDAVRSFFKGGG